MAINPQGYQYGIEPQNVNPFWKQAGNVVGVTATASVLPIGGVPNVEVERTTDPETGDVNLDFVFSGLKGEQGEPGVNGQDGRDGADGKDGQDGADGKDGQDGKDGADGKDGVDGVTPNITITASIMPVAGSIQPMVHVSKSGAPESPNFDFEFENLGGIEVEPQAERVLGSYDGQTFKNLKLQSMNFVSPSNPGNQITFTEDEETGDTVILVPQVLPGIMNIGERLYVEIPNFINKTTGNSLVICGYAGGYYRNNRFYCLSDIQEPPFQKEDTPFMPCEMDVLNFKDAQGEDASITGDIILSKVEYVEDYNNIFVPIKMLSCDLSGSNKPNFGNIMQDSVYKLADRTSGLSWSSKSATPYIQKGLNVNAEFSGKPFESSILTAVFFVYNDYTNTSIQDITVNMSLSDYNGIIRLDDALTALITNFNMQQLYKENAYLEYSLTNATAANIKDRLPAITLATKTQIDPSYIPGQAIEAITEAGQYDIGVLIGNWVNGFKVRSYYNDVYCLGNTLSVSVNVTA